MPPKIWNEPSYKHIAEVVPSLIVEPEVTCSFIEANIVYFTPTSRLEKHVLSFLIVVFSTNTVPIPYVEMYLHKIIGKYPAYSTILQVPNS